MRPRLFVIATLTGIAAAVGLATPASALVLEKERSDTSFFLINGCGATDTVDISTAESKSFDLRPIQPLLGDPVYDEDTGAITGRITDISPTAPGTRLVWTATGSDDLCANADIYPVGSLTQELRFTMAFKYDRRIRTYEVEQKLGKALDRRFPFWRSGFLSRAECHGHEPRWRCRVRFAAGDTSYSGKAKVKVRVKANRPQFRVRYRLRHVNHYCIAVLDRPRSACTDTVRGGAKF
jgi:hypothetical protein